MNPYYFWSLWTFDLVIAIVVLYFFFTGLGDGSITSRNIAIWVLMLAATAIVVVGGWWLHSIHRYLLANTILWILALPGLMFLLYLLIVIIGKPKWN